MLDGKGEVIIKDTGIGAVTIEVLPDVDDEIATLRRSIKSALDTVIAQERAQGKALENQYNQEDTLGKVLINTGAVMQGGWNIIKGLGSAIGAVAEEAGEYILDPLNAPETFKEDVEAVKAKYHALQATTNEAIEAYEVLKDDPKTLDIFTKFASEYIDAQHHTELLEGGSEAVLGIILTILTAGAGAAVAGGRIAALATKIGGKVKKIVDLIKKRKWFKKKKTVQANTKAEVKTVHKPYSKSRPSYKKGQVEETWENAKGRDGKVIDPNTGEELTWDKSKPRNGQWDMGHKPNKEYRKLHKDYIDGKISKEKFLLEYQDPNNYQPESVKSNRSRKYEAK
jgi:hypothetical protein